MLKHYHCVLLCTYMHSTLPRSKKEILHPSLSKDNNCTAKHFMSTESDSKPATDHENFTDEVYIN